MPAVNGNCLILGCLKSQNAPLLYETHYFSYFKSMVIMDKIGTVYFCYSLLSLFSYIMNSFLLSFAAT